MAIGPLELIVIGCPGKRFASEILPELNAIQEQGLVEIVDLLFIRKAADESISMLEVSDLDEQELTAFDSLKGHLTGAITHEDVVKLASTISPDTSATILLLEHHWLGRLEKDAIYLAESLRKALVTNELMKHFETLHTLI